MKQQNTRERWSSRTGFILVAAGAAAGLGNIWKFPYIVGENGGGAFVLVYLACILVVGLPIFMAELALGRTGARNVVDSFASIADESGHSPRWTVIGWIGLLAVLIILSFYGVVGGWAFAYLATALQNIGSLSEEMAAPAEFVKAFEGLAGDPVRSVAWQTGFMVLTAIIVGSGVRSGIERLSRFLVPALFLLLGAMVICAAVTTGKFEAGLDFLFAPDFGKLDAEALLVALGHAFFTLGVGVGAMLTFGSYLPSGIGLVRASIFVVGLDTAMALLAGMAIFPIVFDSGLEADAGPGLVFITLPIAFSDLPGGDVLAAIFFAVLSCAALTSSPSLLEPIVAFIREKAGVHRRTAAILAASLVWGLGVAQALSFSIWSDVAVFGKSLFELSTFTATSVLLPAGGILIALFAGWLVPARRLQGASGIRRLKLYGLWRICLRYVAPAGVAIVMLGGLLG